MKPFLVLCLGNEVLSDDAFGPAVEQRLAGMDFGDEVEVVFASVAGFTLIDLLHQRKAVLIVDAIQTGAEPGTVHFFDAGVLTPSHSLINSHQISLPTALALGARLGYDMPEEIQVLAVEAADVETLSEVLTPPVAQAVEPAITRILNWIALQQGKTTPDGVRRHKASA